MAERHKRAAREADGDGDFDGETRVDQAEAQEPVHPVLAYAPDLEAIADELIGERRQMLRDAEILYAFSGQQHKRSGKVVVSVVRKLNPTERFLQCGDAEAGADFLVTFDRREWLAHTMRQWRCAAVFNALLRIDTKMDTEGNSSWVLRQPTVQAFPDEITAFGAWNEDLAIAADAFKQLPLPLVAD
jgi:hypothetical protein